MLKVGQKAIWKSNTFGDIEVECVKSDLGQYHCTVSDSSHKYLPSGTPTMFYNIDIVEGRVLVMPELEAIELSETFDGTNVDWGPVNLPCEHDWRWYDSGWNRFEYCLKCDQEKGR